MNIQATTGAVHAQVNSGAVASAKKTERPAQPAEPKPQSAPPKPQLTAKDNVQISSTGQAAYQEATETAAQTAQEARNGDLQAQRLLANQAAMKEASAQPTNQNETPGKVSVV
jgi:hypothetical protein